MSSTLTYGLSNLALAVKDVNITKEFYQQIFDMELGRNDIIVKKMKLQ